MKPMDHVHPILTCEVARSYEATVLTGEDTAWEAMKHAGVGIADGILRDFEELRPVPQDLRVLGLIGKGNNGGRVNRLRTPAC